MVVGSSGGEEKVFSTQFLQVFKDSRIYCRYTHKMTSKLITEFLPVRASRAQRKVRHCNIKLAKYNFWVCLFRHG